MKSVVARLARPVALLCVTAVVGSCGLPQVGPNKRQIYAGSVQQEGDAFVVAVNDRVTRATAVVPALGFTDDFKNASRVTADTIRPGDVLGLTIWENVDDGLLSTEGAPATALEQVQVDSSGFIFVPYAGRLRAAGNTPDQLRQLIVSELSEQTPDPQVEVRREPGTGATVSLVGAVSAQGVYTIEQPTRTLGAMLASAGGVAIEPEIAQVTVTRGEKQGQIWFQDLYEHPELDIALRDGDQVLVEGDTRSFTALGAASSQSRVGFESQNLSALEALAQIGGLNTATSDPTGIFVLRNEPAPIAGEVLGRTDLQGAQRLVYVLDLTKPNGLFLARDFVIRDGDTLYVTEAPYYQWTKSLTILTGTLTPFASAQTLFGG